MQKIADVLGFKDRERTLELNIFEIRSWMPEWFSISRPSLEIPASSFQSLTWKKYDFI